MWLLIRNKDSARYELLNLDSVSRIVPGSVAESGTIVFMNDGIQVRTSTAFDFFCEAISDYQLKTVGPAASKEATQEVETHAKHKRPLVVT